MFTGEGSLNSGLTGGLELDLPRAYLDPTERLRCCAKPPLIRRDLIRSNLPMRHWRARVTLSKRLTSAFISRIDLLKSPAVQPSKSDPDVELTGENDLFLDLDFDPACSLAAVWS